MLERWVSGFATDKLQLILNELRGLHREGGGAGALEGINACRPTLRPTPPFAPLFNTPLSSPPSRS